MKRNSFIKKTIIYFIGNFSSKILVSLLIPIYAIYVSTKDLGTYDYMQTVMNVGVVLAFVAIWEAVLRFLIAENNKTKRIYSDNIILFSIVISVIVFFLSMAITLFVGLDLLTAILNAFMNCTYGLAMVWQYLSRAYEQNKIYVRSGVLGTVVNFIMVLLSVCCLKMGLNGLLFSYVLGKGIIIVYIEKNMHIGRSVSLSNFQLPVLKRILQFSLPLAINSFAGWILGGIGSIVISMHFGMKANGLYAFSTKFSGFIISIGAVFVMALVEDVLIEFKKNNNGTELENTIELVIEIFMFISILSLPSIGLFYSLIKKSEYILSLGFTPFTILYAFFSVVSSAIGTLFQVLDKTKYQFITTLMGSLVMCSISISTIDYFGIYAILIGQVIGALVMMISRILFVRKDIPISLNLKKIITFLAIYITFSVFTINNRNILFSAGEIILIIISMYIMFRNYIKDFISKLFNGSNDSDII